MGEYLVGHLGSHFPKCPTNSVPLKIARELTLLTKCSKILPYMHFYNFVVLSESYIHIKIRICQPFKTLYSPYSKQLLT